jgi:hypothetical protein
VRAVVLAAMLSASAGTARAAETAAFLTVGPGARYLALGGAGTALADDADALFWNPAGLSAVEGRQASLSHAELAQNTQQDWASYAASTRLGTLAAGGTYLSQTVADGRDASGAPTGSYSGEDAALSLGWGRGTPLFDAGVAVKFVSSRIASASAQTAALDAGLRGKIERVTLGAAVRDAGPGLKYDVQRNDLPLRLAFGAAYAFPGGHSLAAELTDGPLGAGMDAGFGGEYQVVKNAYLRAGYAARGQVAGGAGLDAASGLTLGLGYRGRPWTIDYAAVPMGELGLAHRFTLGARW